MGSCKNPANKGETNTDNSSLSIPKVIEKQSLYQSLDGHTVKLSDFKGRRILLNFWATWCKPCIEEMPSLIKAKSILEKEGYVFLLASDESQEDIKKFEQTVPFKFKYIKYNGALAQLNIHALPTTFIYNELGEKVHEIIGATEWDSEEVLEILKAIH